MPILTSIGASSAKAFGFTSGGGGAPGQVLTPLLDGTVILNGYGLMIYKTGFSTAGSIPSDAGAIQTVNFTVPENVTKIRVICIGGGGASSGAENVISGQGGGGVEAFLDVTPGETLEVGVGLGGRGNFTSNPGSGGNSYIKRAGSTLLIGYGGLFANSDGTRVSGLISTGTSISVGYGGSRGPSGQPFHAAEEVSLSLAGATAHGGGSSQLWGLSPFATGLGFGGGGGARNTDDPANRYSGGIYGFAGGNGVSTGGNAGLGPVGGWANDSNTNGAGTGVLSGGGGGSFGGAGVDNHSGGYGAGGLVRIWWASSTGDPTWIETGANYGS